MNYFTPVAVDDYASGTVVGASTDEPRRPCRAHASASRPFLGLSLRTRMQEALALHSSMINAALSTADEVEAEQETGVSLARWLQAQRARTDELFASGRFPLPAQVHEQVVPDIDELFGYSLARRLGGFAVMVGEPPSLSSRFADRDT